MILILALLWPWAAWLRGDDLAPAPKLPLPVRDRSRDFLVTA